MKRTIVLAAVLVVAAIAAGCSKNTATSTAPATQNPPATSAPSSTGAIGSGASSTTAAQSTTTAAPTAAAVPAQKPVAPETNPPGDIPDNTQFVPYRSLMGFVVKVPEGWSRRAASGAVTFTDKLNTVDVATTGTATSPTVANVKSTDVPALAKSEPAFEFRSISAVKLPAGPAVLLKYRINSAPNSVTGKQYRLDVERYILWRSGMRYDLILLSPVGADNVDPWRIVSRSLAFR